MLVGDVREATTGTGSSWKLSGGSQCSSAVTKVSKKRQVLRAVRRRKANCLGFSSGAVEGSIGWLIRQAIHGEASQRLRIGAANSNSEGCIKARKDPVARPMNGPIHI